MTPPQAGYERRSARSRRDRERNDEDAEETKM
jgi:hypothetical protein